MYKHITRTIIITSLNNFAFYQKKKKKRRARYKKSEMQQTSPNSPEKKKTPFPKDAKCYDHIHATRTSFVHVKILFLM